MMSSAPSYRCTICGGSDAVTLPVPHPAHAMLSDGRLVARPVRKVSCLGCGLVSAWPRLQPGDVRQFYDRNYDLGLGIGAGDAARGARYARVMAEAAGTRHIMRVLEVGCGSGHTLAALHDLWPAAEFIGIEAAPQLAGRDGPARPRIAISQGFVEDLPKPDPLGRNRAYDLVYAINVIEHAVDPQEFLARAADQLAADGCIVLICPAATLPNLELVFLDHIHTFTQVAFARLADRVGLRIAAYAERPDGLGDFQIVVLERGHRQAAGAGGSTQAETAADLATRRETYLAGWARLDRTLTDRCAAASRLALFGAGEAAALVRAYAPMTWARVALLMVDDTAGARTLDRPVVRYGDASARDIDAVIVATHPRAQAALAARLGRDGFSAIRFDDLITC
jgi:trans-aconitate methyltransferase